jgi:hypothetical protein
MMFSSSGADLQRLIRLLAPNRRIDDHIGQHRRAVEVMAGKPFCGS